MFTISVINKEHSGGIIEIGVTPENFGRSISYEDEMHQAEQLKHQREHQLAQEEALRRQKEEEEAKRREDEERARREAQLRQRELETAASEREQEEKHRREAEEKRMHEESLKRELEEKHRREEEEKRMHEESLRRELEEKHKREDEERRREQERAQRELEFEEKHRREAEERRREQERAQRELEEKLRREAEEKRVYQESLREQERAHAEQLRLANDRQREDEEKRMREEQERLGKLSVRSLNPKGARGFSLVRGGDCPHGTHVPLGHQVDGVGVLYLIVAHTQFGDIPGKSDGTQVHFGHGGSEHGASDFSWVVAPEHTIVPHKGTGSAPKNALSIGSTYAVITHSQFGNIPGIFTGTGNATFAYGGSERSTAIFSWVVTSGKKEKKKRSTIW